MGNLKKMTFPHKNTEESMVLGYKKESLTERKKESLVDNLTSSRVFQSHLSGGNYDMRKISEII